ncbi:MAG TPA: HTH domain-containing protein [Anaerolineales bacterium]|jgi:mannitol operon transcriptional antiterminator
MLPNLNNRQRDILKIILGASKPIGSAELANLLHLTPRQVNYSIPAVREWLKQHNEDLKIQPGVGFGVSTTREHAQALQHEISLPSDAQILLSASQRQQLLALFLLTKSDPFILSQLEQIMLVSRMTISKDLDEIEAWFSGQQIELTRKPHFGVQVNCAEPVRQQALAKVIWGETLFSKDPVAALTHADGLVFHLKGDARLLPVLEYVNTFLLQINIRRTIGLVAKAEELLGGRFTDDAVLNLALIFAIMANRVQGAHHLETDEQLVAKLQGMPIWPVATFIAQRLGRDSNSIWKPVDIAGIAMELLAAQRNEILPGELTNNHEFAVELERLMDYISQSFQISKMKYDQTLFNGLLNNIIPACFRQRFNLWFPDSLRKVELPEEAEREYGIAEGIARIVNEQTGVTLGENDLNILVMLLRAAYIRNRSYLEHVIIVCPSGMATAQLLMARLNARFPYLTSLEVVSLRDLTSALVLSADLILTTVPLPRQFGSNPKVIQVHPLLMPEDIEAITRFLS